MQWPKSKKKAEANQIGIAGYLTQVLLDRGYVGIFLAASRHAKPSLIGSLDDDRASQASQELVSLISEAAQRAVLLHIHEDSQLSDSRFFNVFPGEHYRILAGLIQVLKPASLVDVGTSTGMSSRVMLDFAFEGAQIDTFDIIRWDEFDTHLTNADFRLRRFQQHTADLGSERLFDNYFHLLDSADLIFCDAPKDGDFEYKFLKLLSGRVFSRKKRYLVLDDIRFLNMAPLWRSVKSPKLDLTSFGHWSGTGIVDLSAGLQLGHQPTP